MKKMPKLKVTKLELFHVRAGAEHYHVASKDFMTGMQASWEKHGAKTSDDLPKPWSFDRATDDLVLVVEVVKQPRKVRA